MLVHQKPGFFLNHEVISASFTYSVFEMLTQKTLRLVNDCTVGAEASPWSFSLLVWEDVFGSDLHSCLCVFCLTASNSRPVLLRQSRASSETGYGSGFVLIVEPLILTITPRDPERLCSTVSRGAQAGVGTGPPLGPISLVRPLF